jgi:hypothetical protein
VLDGAVFGSEVPEFGLKNNASSRDANRPAPRVRASARKKTPVTPESKTSGANTTITVAVEAISGPREISEALKV